LLHRGSLVRQYIHFVRQYIPSDPQAMDAASQAGKASLNTASGTLTFSDCAKPGDKVPLAFDTVTKKIRSFAVSHLSGRAQGHSRVNARFFGLADGAFLEESVLTAKVKEIQIKTANFGHRKGSS
jgi:hypothetical protein